MFLGYREIMTRAHCSSSLQEHFLIYSPINTQKTVVLLGFHWAKSKCLFVAEDKKPKTMIVPDAAWLQV